MGILDEAIKEHLELKRAHGAAEDELKQLEDEAFGAAERPGDEDSAPDAAAEAPTEFMVQPDLEQPFESGAEDESSRRRPDVADLQEAPPPPAPPEPPDEPAEEESPAMEHEAVSEPEAAAPEPPEVEPEISSGPTTEEREAIAEQPTEMHDMEAELGGDATEQAPTEADAADESSDEEEYEEDDDFWDEKRLSDELDQALEAPSEPEPEAEPEEALYEDAATEAEETEPEPAQPEQPEPSSPAGADEEDVLEETPDFLEEAPEDDQLWFEQKPPKDFDFDD